MLQQDQGSVSRMRGAAWPHKPSYPTAPPGRDAGSYTGPRLILLPPTFPFQARKAAQPFQSRLLLCKTALPRPFLCVTPIAARPPHGRPAGAQASNSEQHVARLAAGRAPGHRLSCLPRSNSAALCAPRHAGAGSRVFTEHLPLLQGPSALPSCSGISPSWQLTE